MVFHNDQTFIWYSCNKLWDVKLESFYVDRQPTDHARNTDDGLSDDNRFVLDMP